MKVSVVFVASGLEDLTLLTNEFGTFLPGNLQSRDRTVNYLYYGDNLDIRRKYIQNESVDLIYLDPPFKSDQSHNILFQERNGSKSRAQIKAFGDTWRWDLTAEETWTEIIQKSSNKKLAELMIAMRRFLRENDMMAYLVMMAIRLQELHKVLKSTGSIYLHCDPTASHYLKLVMDAVFGHKNFQNEVIWWYHDPSGTTKQRYMRKHDVILFYANKKHIFNADDVRAPYKKGTLEQGKRGTISFGRPTKTHPKGRLREDVWEMAIINSQAKERLGYPKNQKLF